MDYYFLLRLLPFVILFLVHHFLLAPMLYRNKALYFILTVALLVLFAFSCFNFGWRPGMNPDLPERPELPEWAEERFHEPPKHRGPMRPEVMEVILGVFVIAGDLGLVAWGRMKKNERQLQELKAESLHQQLESLRYQINPHFFMNTLNNIQSLIYTDPDKATEAVSEFSKLMRIVLYEGDDNLIPLGRELDFLRHFLSLMKIRYPESVRIEAVMPQETEGAMVPPLLMASFVENAFKHGISYKKPSFVKIRIEATRSRVLFHCTNSRHDLQQTEQHGLGMENVTKRLKLLYGSNYVLRIDEQADTYDILLDIPAKPSVEA